MDKERLSTFHLGYIIGPCLNASGRLDSAKKGISLLLSETKNEAIELATELRNLNEERKDMTAEYREGDNYSRRTRYAKRYGTCYISS